MKRKFRNMLLFVVFGFAHIIVYATPFQSIYSFASWKVADTNSQTVSLEGGFQKMYAPTGVSGCAIGVQEFKSLCAYPGAGVLSFGFPGYTYPTNVNEVKIYIPPGAFRFSLYGFLPQGTIAAAALRLDQPPVRVNELSASEYNAARAQVNNDTAFQELLAGKELIRTHDGGGTFKVVWGYANSNSILEKTTAGRWLYIRFINQTDIDGFTSAISIDLPTYKAWYSSAQWDTNGDPIDTNSGSSGGTTTPTPSSFSIALSKTPLTQGISSTVAVTPSGGTLKSCSASSVAVGASSYANSSVTLTPSSTATSVTINCESAEGGSAIASLPVQTAPATAFTSFTLSPSSLLKTDTETRITVEPNPGATVPASTICQVMQDGEYLVPYDGVINQWKINPDAHVSQSARSLNISCGKDASGKSITSTFSILEPLTITRNSTDLSQLTDLTFTFRPTLPANISTADLYIFVYVPSIPISAFKQTTTLYGYQVKNGKVQIGGSWTDVQNQLLPILFSPPDAYQKYVSSGTSFTVNLGYGVKGDLATAVKAEYYVAYLPTGTTDLTKLQFIGDKQGSFSGIPVFWKF